MDITTYAFYYFLLHRSNVSLTGFINFCDLDIPRDILPHLLATEIPNTFNASISYSYFYFLVISCPCFHDLSHIPNYFTSNKVAVSVVSNVVHVNSTVLVTHARWRHELRFRLRFSFFSYYFFLVSRLCMQIYASIFYLRSSKMAAIHFRLLDFRF